jgi:inhibitor of KinA sporulation pathway (predicted exonuclease)
MQNGLSKTIKMTDALKNNNIPLEGVLHRAGDDSLNTAKLFIKSMIK